MNWYTWLTQADFNDWHQTVITGLHLPKIGVNQATGKPEPTKQLTIAYTSVTEVDVDDWRAPVEENIALLFPEGLGQLSTEPPVEEYTA